VLFKAKHLTIRHKKSRRVVYRVVRGMTIMDVVTMFAEACNAASIDANNVAGGIA
jgi:succinate dehydrogenase flavin-adding protein (antitoxin of CptAB toxin-antitoxin module)